LQTTFACSPSTTSLQVLVDLCSTYANDHIITFNASKTVCIHFKSKESKILATAVKMNGTCLTWETNFNYLGYTIDSIKVYRIVFVEGTADQHELSSSNQN